MKKSTRRTLALVGALITLTCWVMAHSGNAEKSPIGPDAKPVEVHATATGPVSLSGHLVQGKLPVGGDGTVTLALTLGAAQMPDLDGKRPLDMVVVLDRSGSMAEAGKISNATQAILGLLSRLSDADRFALISYSEEVQTHCTLLSMTPSNRAMAEGMVRRIQPNGATNLGAGLEEGLRQLTAAERSGRIGRLLLISDGLANRGVTDPEALARMASVAAERGFAVSTIGVGLDFNEQLMSAIADKGTGTYSFLESAAAFARVFDKEFRSSKAVAASAVEIRVPLASGVALVHAAGFPVEVGDGYALFRPGDLLSGQSRKLFLTLRVPTGEARDWSIGPIAVHYRSGERSLSTALPEPLHVACVADAKEAVASIDKAEWESKVVQEDYNRLREEVATAVKEGKKDEAMKQIDDYTARQQALNATVGSAVVSGNLEKEVGGLRETVADSFTGPAPAAAIKQKANSKALQYEGYQGRRAKN